MVDQPRSLRRLEVITGVGRRRRWSSAEKARILEEATTPGSVVSEVARRHDMSPQHLFTWCRAARRQAAAQDGVAFAPVVVEPDKPKAHDARMGDAIEVTMGEALVRIPPGSDARMVATVLRALKRER